MKIVTLANGKNAPKKDSYMIDGEYFLKADLIKIGGTFYKKEDPTIVYNTELNIWEKKTRAHILGLVVKQEGLDFGYFKKSSLSFIFDDDVGHLSNVEELKSFMESNNNAIIINNILHFLSYVGEHVYWRPQTNGNYCYTKQRVPTEGLPYEVQEVDISSWIKKSETLYTEVVSEELNGLLEKWGSLLKYSVGVEYETSDGILSNDLSQLLGVIKLRDGSLKGGYEYSTIPYAGKKALFYNILTPIVLQKQHSINERCSLHVHFGGYPRDKKSILCLYLLLYRLQQEIGEFIAPYRKTPQFMQKVILAEGKDYCAPLPAIINPYKTDLELNWKEVFNEFYLFLTSGKSPNEEYNFDTRVHPVKQKYNRKARYHNYNLLPMVFGKTETVEARWHTTTLNPYKIINWIFINNAILEFAEKHQDRILSKEKLDLLDILSIYKEKGEEGALLFHYLYNYIEDRKETFTNYFVVNHEYYPFEKESSGDCTFVPRFIPDELQTIFDMVRKVFTG